MSSCCLLYIYLVLLFFFFFQAEDGIRDYKVTGVQTCALPISTAVQATLRLRRIPQPILEALANDRIVRLIGIGDHNASIRRQLRANKGFVRSDNTKGIGIQPIKP